MLKKVIFFKYKWLEIRIFKQIRAINKRQLLSV